MQEANTSLELELGHSVMAGTIDAEFAYDCLVAFYTEVGDSSVTPDEPTEVCIETLI